MNNFSNRLAATATLALAALLAGGSAQAASVVVDVSGAQSINLQGEAGNTVWLVNIGANAVLSSLDWDVTLDAYAPSSRSDMQISFGDSGGLNAINFAPELFGNAGSLDLTGLGVSAGADGLLRLEFSETYKDFAVGVSEGQWLSGTLSFGVSAVPEPASASLALLGLGLLGLRRRRASGAQGGAAVRRT